jgi:hypothetical protein
MSTLNSLEEIWRRSFDLNLRYYGAVGKLTADYVRDLASTFIEARKQQDASGSPTQPLEPPIRPPSEPVATTAGTAKSAGTMVLEGISGSRVLGVFLVENHLDHPISARVVSSSFVSANGGEVSPTMVFDPEAVVLGAREQALVRVVVFIDETMAPEVRYLGQLTIPELMGTPIPVVLRRLIDPDLPSVATSESKEPKKTSKAGKSSKTKTTSRRRHAKKNQSR